MNLLRLESPLVDAPRMSDLQPDEDQLMVPIHRSEDQAVLGSTSLSFLSVVSHDKLPLALLMYRPTAIATKTAIVYYVQLLQVTGYVR
ncbi:hypothetical protein Tco_0970511 [Tanacetum coccineum]